jgi:hypothetical protein
MALSKEDKLEIQFMIVKQVNRSISLVLNSLEGSSIQEREIMQKIRRRITRPLKDEERKAEAAIIESKDPSRAKAIREIVPEDESLS